MKKYIENPAVKLTELQQDNLTASGPPLPVLIRSLGKLRDLRMAEDRADISSRYADLQKLKGVL